LTLAKDFESEIKQIKHSIYKIGWYMRGSVNSETLFCDTDLEDIDILNKIVEENIEASKKSGLNLI
jgi:hypothetical protein